MSTSRRSKASSTTKPGEGKVETHVYGILGFKGVGKDYFAQTVKAINPDFKTISLATPLKEMAAKIFGLTQDDMYHPVIKERLFDEPLDMDLFIEQMSEATGLAIQPQGKKATGPRQIMQYLGTEYVRRVKDSYWTDIVLDTIKNNPCSYLVPDTRFLNEADALRSIGGKIIRINRIDQGSSSDLHPSEQEALKVVPDLTILKSMGDTTLQNRVAGFIATNDFQSAKDFDYPSYINETSETKTLVHQFLDNYYKLAGSVPDQSPFALIRRAALAVQKKHGDDLLVTVIKGQVHLKLGKNVSMTPDMEQLADVVEQQQPNGGFKKLKFFDNKVKKD